MRSSILHLLSAFLTCGTVDIWRRVGTCVQVVDIQGFWICHFYILRCLQLLFSVCFGSPDVSFLESWVLDVMNAVLYYDICAFWRLAVWIPGILHVWIWDFWIRAFISCSANPRFPQLSNSWVLDVEFPETLFCDSWTYGVWNFWIRRLPDLGVLQFSELWVCGCLMLAFWGFVFGCVDIGYPDRWVFGGLDLWISSCWILDVWIWGQPRGDGPGGSQELDPV